VAPGDRPHLADPQRGVERRIVRRDAEDAGELVDGAAVRTEHDHRGEHVQAGARQFAQHLAEAVPGVEAARRIGDRRREKGLGPPVEDLGQLGRGETREPGPQCGGHGRQSP
jgi:hypothetical protein